MKCTTLNIGNNDFNFLVSPGGSWQGLSPNRVPRSQGRGSTPTPPSTPSTPGSTHGSVGNLTQPRKPPTFITVSTWILS